MKIEISFNAWPEGNVSPSVSDAVVLSPVNLPARSPISSRISKRMVHPDRHRRVTALSFSADGSKIIGSTFPDNNIQIWDARTGTQLKLINLPDRSTPFRKFWTLNSDGSRLYSCFCPQPKSKPTQKNGKAAYTIAYPDNCIQVWDTRTGKLLESLTSEPPHRVRNLIESRDARYLISTEDPPGTFFRQSPPIHRLWDLEMGKSKILESSLGIPLAFDNTGKRLALKVLDGSKPYSIGLSIVDRENLERLGEFKLPNGIHDIIECRFSDDNQHVIFKYQTYAQVNNYSNWQTTIACADSATGETLGTFRYPFENDGPLFMGQHMTDQTLVFSSWRSDPTKLFGVTFPDLKPKWEVKLKDYSIAMGSIVFDHGQKLAVICHAEFDSSSAVVAGKLDWNQIPQNDLKIISKNGVILESITLPVGAETIAKSRDGNSFAIGAAGAVYGIDLSEPFENEAKQVKLHTN